MNGTSDLNRGNENILEYFLVFQGRTFKWEIDSDGPAPFLTRPHQAIPAVLPDKSQLGIQRDSDLSISRKLECGSVVEGPHHISFYVSFHYLVDCLLATHIIITIFYYSIILMTIMTAVFFLP